MDIKLERANEYLAFLDSAREAFLAAEDRRVVGEFDSETGDYVFRVVGEIPSWEWGVRVGEFAHTLRTSLDNTLWELIRKRGGRPKEGVTQFPIYEDETKWKRKAQRQIDGVLQEDRAFIKRAQPFQLESDPHGRPLFVWHPLAMLGHLNNLDKHRAIHTSFAAASVTTIQPRGPARSFLLGTGRLGLGFVAGTLPVWGLPSFRSPDGSVTGDEGLSFLGRDDDPTEIARVFKIVTDSPNPKMEMEPSPTLDISFSSRERPMDIYATRHPELRHSQHEP